LEQNTDLENKLKEYKIDINEYFKILYTAKTLAQYNEAPTPQKSKFLTTFKELNKSL